jgi:hypothetical protein
MAFARFSTLASIALVAAACSGIPTTTPAPLEVTAGEVLAIPNNGGSMEGHTPSGFPGMGTGLFAGDNLNSSFPEGVGVQIYLTFALPTDRSVGSAHIVSDALHITGAPFDDLGMLVAEPVTYEVFGPELFNLPSIGPHVGCTVVAGTSIECDVTSAVREATDRGDDAVQVRLRFEQQADNDGRQDLAMFYRVDSNTNESGIFELEITFNG